MGDFTLDVALWVQANSDADLKNINSVQHSNWNINNSGEGVYDELIQLVSHHKINDGNGDYNSNAGGDKQAFADKAAAGAYAALWAKIWEGDGGWQEKIDFSDTTEMLWILEKQEFVKSFDSTKEPWENFIDIYNAPPTCDDGSQNQGEEGVDCGGPCPVACPEPTCDDGIQNQEEEGVDCGGPCAEPCHCGVDDYQGECNTTSQCKGMYADAFDCKNSEGGVCFCGNNNVCGCVTSNPPTPPAPAPSAPVPSPPTPPTTCGVQSYQNECKFTSQCKDMYETAYDCKNSEGGVCFCGDNQVCGCL